MDRRRDPGQLVAAQRPGDQAGHHPDRVDEGSGGDDLSAVPGAHDPRREVDVDADVAVGGHGRRPDVKAHTHPHRRLARLRHGRNRSLELDRRARGGTWVPERQETLVVPDVRIRPAWRSATDRMSERIWPSSAA